MAVPKPSSDTDLPTTFFPEPIIGHIEAQKRIRELETSTKFPHGLLIYGPKGIGKRLFAENLAWGMICGFDPEAPQQIQYNKNSNLAPVMAHGAHAGFATLEQEGQFIKVEQVRQVIQKLSYVDEGWRVVIVDAADNLNKAAANALLKTLEEPRGRTLLILVSHAPSKLLPTLVSRCRKIRLSPLCEKDIEKVFQEKVSSALPQHIKNMADGSPGYALYLHEHGRELIDTLSEVLNKPEKELQDAVSISEKLLKSAPEHSMLFDILLWLLAEKSRELVEAGHTHKAFVWSDIHQKTQKIIAEQSEFNLTAQLALEKILSDIFKRVN